MSETYVIATIHEWNVALFHELTPHLPGGWHLITSPESLSCRELDALAPRYVFFPHWSARVPDDVIAAHECVCFHMTDVPYGRGGTPLQNLIIRGHRFTRMSALRMEHALDAGPVYMKRTLSLDGRAEDIYRRGALLVFDMIADIVMTHPVPIPQSGTPTVFSRRRPKDSQMPDDGTLDTLHDHIRMLDAPGYPHAFLRHGRWHMTFTHAEPVADGLTAHVRITEHDLGGNDRDA